MESGVIVYVDKTVVKIRGVKVTGLKPYELEKKLEEHIKRRVRIIGVTGESVDMDVYGIEASDIISDSEGIIKVVSTTEGISATDLIRIEKAEKIVEVDYERFIADEHSGCARERWLKHD